MKSQKSLIILSVLFGMTVFPIAAFADEKPQNTSIIEEKKPEPMVFTRILRQGTYGKDVYELQTILTDLGYYTGFNTGIFGPKTTSAVNVFKKKHNLPINGIIDQSTIASLDNVSRLDISFEQPQVKKAKVAVSDISPKASMTTKVTAPLIVATPISINTTEDISVDPNTSEQESDIFTGNHECFVSAIDAIIECNTATSGIEYIVKPQNKKAVVKISNTLLHKKSQISLKPILEGKSSKWMLNVGNSKFNDGWGGGMPSDAYNAEFQIVDGILGVFKGDNENKTVSGAKTLFARDIGESVEDSEIIISQGNIEFISKNSLEKPVIVKDKNLFVFETSSNEKKDIYIGLNRTIYDADRNGTGIKGIMITISEEPSEDSTETSN